MFFLKVLFRDEGHLYANCLFSIPTSYLKCHCFHLFSRGIRIYIPILTGFQNEPQVTEKTVFFFFAKKMFLLKLLFHKEGHLNANCLLYIPTIYPKRHLFQFFSRGIRMHIPILTGVQNRRISLRKNSHILLKNVLLEALFRRWRSVVSQIFLWYFDYLFQIESSSVL